MDIEIHKAVMSAVTTVVSRRLLVDDELVELATSVVRAQAHLFECRGKLLDAAAKKLLTDRLLG
jgi:hypothetical protein